MPWEKSERSRKGDNSTYLNTGLGLYFSDIVNGIYLWMWIDPFEMFVFAFDVLLFMLVTAR